MSYSRSARYNVNVKSEILHRWTWQLISHGIRRVFQPRPVLPIMTSHSATGAECQRCVVASSNRPPQPVVESLLVPYIISLASRERLPVECCTLPRLSHVCLSGAPSAPRHVLRNTVTAPFPKRKGCHRSIVPLPSTSLLLEKGDPRVEASLVSRASFAVLHILLYKP